MLKVSNPELPTTDPGYVSEQAPLVRLYSDTATRAPAGILAKLSKSANYAEGIDALNLGEPVAKGFFHRVDLEDAFNAFGLISFVEKSDPRELSPRSFWINETIVGLYSQQSLEGQINPFVEIVKTNRFVAGDEIVELDIPGITPTAVVSGGYAYQEGAGENEWQYSDPVLSINTTPQTQIEPGVDICIQAMQAIAVGPPALQILTFVLDSNATVLGVDYLGRSFTPPFDIYSPQNGDFTVSSNGLLNLYVSIGVALPNTAEQNRKRLNIGGGSLSYDRPT